MKFIIVLSLILAVAWASPVDPVEKVEELVEAPQSEIANEPVADAAGTLASLVGASSSSAVNLTALIQQIVKDEIQKILMGLQAAKNFTVNLAQSASTTIVNADESEEKPAAVVVKQEEKPVQPVEKPVYFLPRRPGYFPPPHPYYYGSQQPIPYHYNEQPYPLYRAESAGYGDQRWRRINPTNDESLSDLEALAELELLLNGKEDVISEAEARGITSSLMSTTNSAKAGFKSFVNSLRSLPSALPTAFPSFSIVKKTYLVPGLAISG